MNKKVFNIAAGTAGTICSIRVVERGVKLIVVEKLTKLELLSYNCWSCK